MRATQKRREQQISAKFMRHTAYLHRTIICKYIPQNTGVVSFDMQFISASRASDNKTTLMLHIKAGTSMMYLICRLLRFYVVPCCVCTWFSILVMNPHDDVIKWKHFPRYWPFVRGHSPAPVNSPHIGQWCGALMFSLIWVWIKG